MKPRITLALTAAALLSASPGHTQVLKDAQWQAWLDAGKTPELERAAKERLKAQPGDTEGVVALAMVALDEGQSAKLDAVQPDLQACVDKKPLAVCHYALGRVYGQQAMTASVFKMPGLASKTKEQFLKAVELDPMLYEARNGLAQFYLMAPGIAGGSVPKAKELAEQAQAKQPEYAKILRAVVAMNEKDWAGAERELGSVKPGDDKILQREQRGGWSQLGFAFIDQKNLPKARATFETLQRDYPAQALGPYGLGRVLIELNQPDEAIKALERSRSLEGAERLPIDHRLGIALIAKGDKPAAKAALERYVTNKRANPRNLEDAKKRLAELG